MVRHFLSILFFSPILTAAYLAASESPLIQFKAQMPYSCSTASFQDNIPTPQPFAVNESAQLVTASPVQEELSERLVATSNLVTLSEGHLHTTYENSDASETSTPARSRSLSGILLGLSGDFFPGNVHTLMAPNLDKFVSKLRKQFCQLLINNRQSDPSFEKATYSWRCPYTHEQGFGHRSKVFEWRHHCRDHAIDPQHILYHLVHREEVLLVHIARGSFIVGICPFCPDTFYNEPTALANHIYTSHITGATINCPAQGCSYSHMLEQRPQTPCELFKCLEDFFKSHLRISHSRDLYTFASALTGSWGVLPADLKRKDEKFVHDTLNQRLWRSGSKRRKEK